MRKLTLATLTLIALFASFSAYAQTNKVLSLDGDGDYVLVPDSSILDPIEDFTLSAWIYISPRREVFVIGKHQASRDKDGSWYLKIENSGRITICNGRLDTGWQWISSNDNLVEFNKWFYIAITFSDAENFLRFYVNGSLVGENIVDFEILDNDRPLHIGSEENYQGHDFAGIIDEARIWNYARTEEQIQSAMNTTLTGLESGLVAYWNFDDGTANDLTANNNDGTLNGDANIVDQYYVSPSGNDANEGSKEDPFKTIQHAIDQSGRGDVITALPGTYEENITLVGDLTLQGSGTDQTIITASGGNVVTANNVYNVTLSGFTIDGQGTADNGILCSGSTSELEIRDNTITNAGDGIECTDEASAEIKDNRIFMNSNHGIYCSGNSDLEINSNEIYKNQRCGIWCNNENTTTIKSNQIYENQWQGVRCENSSKVEVAFNTISYSGGAGIWFAQTQIQSGKIVGNLIQSNEIEGIVLMALTAPNIIRNIIRDNGSGIGCYHSSNPTISGSIVNANTIVDNRHKGFINHGNQVVNATYNYWGTDDESEIENMMRNTGDGSIIFKPFIGDPELIGNVSGSGGITAYDASLILQYVVGLIDQLPANIASIGENITPRNRTISIPNVSVKINELISVPIIIDEPQDLVAGGITIKYDPTVLQSRGIRVTSDSLLNDTYWKSKVDNDEIRFAFSKDYSEETNNSKTVAMLEFEAISSVEGITTDLIIDHAQITESIAIAKVDGHVTFLPSKTALLQNYPNPFNPETWIPFKLSDDANVVISIYDISGQLVRRIGLGNTPAGMYLNKEKAIYWDGRNSSGEKVSSGLYFYQLQAGEYSKTKRMLIMK